MVQVVFASSALTTLFSSQKPRLALILKLFLFQRAFSLTPLAYLYLCPLGQHHWVSILIMVDLLAVTSMWPLALQLSLCAISPPVFILQEKCAERSDLGNHLDGKGSPKHIYFRNGFALELHVPTVLQTWEEQESSSLLCHFTQSPVNLISIWDHQGENIY